MIPLRGEKDTYPVAAHFMGMDCTVSSRFSEQDLGERDLLEEIENKIILVMFSLVFVHLNLKN